MANFKYLICLALIKQGENRAMPLGGKSVQIDLKNKHSLDLAKEKIALELLLRVLKRTESGYIRQVAGDQSLLLIQMDLEVMQEKLPNLKAEWIFDGNSEKFITKLSQVCEKGWTVNFIKHEGVEFSKCF